MDLALHIGVDSKGKSKVFEHDAVALQRLTAGAGFQSDAILGLRAKPIPVLAAIEDGLNRTSAGRLMILSFSTHGLSDGSREERVYLHGGWIKDREIHRLLETRLKPGARLVLIANACMSRGLFSTSERSGSMSGVATGVLGVVNALAERLRPPTYVAAGSMLASRTDFRGRVLELAAADKDQLARVGEAACCIDGVQHGCFVAAILAAMGQTPPPGSWRALLATVRERVREVTSGRQEPQFTTAGAADPELDALPPFQTTTNGEPT